MIDTGIVRRIDELGRVVIPKGIRKNLSIKAGDLVEIYLDKEQVILKKYTPKQYFTKETFNMLKSIGESINKRIVFGSLEQIIFSTDKDLKNTNVTEKLKQVVLQDKNVVLNLGEVIDIENDYNEKYKKQAIMTLKNSDGTIFGFISILSQEEDITSQDLTILSLAVKTLEKNL